MQPTRVFIHGLESSGQGTKGLFFRERYPDTIVEDYAGSFAERMKKLEILLEGKNNLILVGSSYGGLMAAAFACQNMGRVKKLVLLAPALHLEPYEPYRSQRLSMPIVIFHGLQDDVVPLISVKGIAERLYENLVFSAVDDDHQLRNTFATFDWNALLEVPAASGSSKLRPVGTP